MATYKELEDRKIEITFVVGDLLLSNIQNTKKTLSEVIKPASFSLQMNGVHDLDSSGLQLLVYFISTIKNLGGNIELSALSPEIINICTSYGIEDLASAEKKIYSSLENAGGANV